MKSIFDKFIRTKSLYLIEAVGCMLVKIGISSDVEERFRQINNSVPCRLIIYGTWKGEAKKIQTLEKRFHDEFKNKQVKGEWFRLSKKDIEHIEEILNEGKS